MNDPHFRPERSLRERMAAGLRNLTELEVLTVVAAGGDIAGLVFPAEGDRADRRGALKALIADGASVYFTRIDLVAGDCLTVVPPPAAADEAVHEFHHAQVEQGREIIDRNLQLLGRMLREFREFLPGTEARGAIAGEEAGR